jgi:hypothetical protein
MIPWLRVWVPVDIALLSGPKGLGFAERVWYLPMTNTRQPDLKRRVFIIQVVPFLA